MILEMYKVVAFSSICIPPFQGDGRGVVTKVAGANKDWANTDGKMKMSRFYFPLRSQSVDVVGIKNSPWGDFALLQ